MALHTDDTVFRLHLLGAGDVTGRDAVRNAFAGLLALWPDLHFGIDQLTVGDGFFVTQYTMTGTLAAAMPFGTLIAEPTGEPIRCSSVDVITVADGRVHRKNTYIDIADGLQQLGVLDHSFETAF